jgi:hypothetical protein
MEGSCCIEDVMIGDLLDFWEIFIGYGSEMDNSLIRVG